MVKYIGIPYKDRGRTMDGFDCWGLVCYISEHEYNNVLPCLGYEYENSKNIKEISKSFKKTVSKFSQVDHVSAGDIVAFRIGGLACHVGLYIGHNYFIHTLFGHNSAIERLDHILWKDRIAGYYHASYI